MRHSTFWVVCLLVGALAVLPAFGDESTVSLETRILEDFDDLPDGNYDWRAKASKFTHIDKDDSGEATASWPQLKFVSAKPSALFKTASFTGADGEEHEYKSLGLWGKFDRRGYNWIDIYPVAKGDEGEGGEPAPVEIPIPGRAAYFDLWIWGSNLNFYVEAYVRDYIGITHVLKVGNINYTGWKNLRVSIPNHIPQTKKMLPRLESLKFIKFRLWTQPTEKVDNFYVYFDHFKVLTDIFESLYDGDDLASPENVSTLWEAQDE
ncbi:flagellar filament outer layer protein FlaA [Breznakiellaceae bacterium SP9]